MATPAELEVSIIIPVLNKLEFTRQCLDRIWRHSAETIPFEVVVVDNGSSDGTPAWFGANPRPALHYHRNATNLGFAKGNNIGASLSRGRHLLFLNNDTLVRPGWMSEMLRVMRSDPAVGIVGLKQLFPYTNSIYHTGVVFAADRMPQHLYPHLDASLPQVNKEREYQAVNGACLLISRALFDECGGFDEAYVNGYEDTDLCMKVRQRGRKVVCCTSAFIYHYAQISEGRTVDDDQNASLFANRWRDRVRIDQADYLVRDGAPSPPVSRPLPATARSLPDDCIYLADDLGHASAFTWVNVELALALTERGAAVTVNGSRLSPTIDSAARKRLSRIAAPDSPVGGVQIRWSHYWSRHLALELNGRTNLEFFVINYRFGRPGSEPWDYWLQSLRQNHYAKLPVSEFCGTVLEQIGIPSAECHVLHHGYSREVDIAEPLRRRGSGFRFLTVTNSHDLPRYNTTAIIDAYEREFTAADPVTLVVKDYGASAVDTSLRERLQRRTGGPALEYLSEFTDKRELIGLYKSCDAFVSAHRGEGFGMKILDAMVCGLPVVTPLFGGPTAYCTPQNCLPVAFSMTGVTDGVDAKSLTLFNEPLWAEVDADDLQRQLRKVYTDRAAAATIARTGRADVIERFSWDRAATRLLQIVSELKTHRTPAFALRATAGQAGTASPEPAGPAVAAPALAAQPAERSPYWLGLRVSVVIPTHNRKAALGQCLDALARQSVLPQEFEVVIVDDGSTDGTREAVEERREQFQVRYFRQEPSGPGAARNLGIEKAAGELVLMIGDDIYADERLIEEHLLAHAAYPDAGTAILGHIDWPASMTPNAVMEYVCGEANLQFAYPLIRDLPVLDHRFFYTSNISLKRSFLLDAAAAGVRFDPCFRHAAFEDSEFALRLTPRGLRIQYAERARAVHDHWIDLETFAAREFRAGEMATVFYRKHPAHEADLRVQQLGELVRPAAALRAQPDLLHHLEAFDLQTDRLLRACAGSFEELLAMSRHPESGAPAGLALDRVRAGLHNVLRVIFDVERTRGKVQEWYAGVRDTDSMRTAQTLAAVMRKIDFLTRPGYVPGMVHSTMAGFDARVLAELRERVATVSGQPEARSAVARSSRALRQLVARPAIISRLVQLDRSIVARLRKPERERWLKWYSNLRSRARSALR
jgi:GT2 family glycosyltransferase/glycosyltransferase involved in cell wall biosynthesis